MFLPTTQTVKNEFETQAFTLGMGENQYGTPFTINEAESRASMNLSSRKFPALATRPGRTKLGSSLTTPNGLGARDNLYIHAMDGLVWKRWDGTTWYTLGSVTTSARTNFVDFTTGTSKRTIMTNGTNRYSWDGVVGNAIVDLTAFPLSRLVTVHRGRVYAMVGRDLKFSALNLINDWTTANDAGSITITNAKSDAVAITEYSDHVVILTGSSLHELHGTGPGNYQLVDISEDGCVAERTVINHRGVLYWLDEGEFKAYNGSLPVVISNNIKDYLKGINTTYKWKSCCGRHGKYIYLSIPSGTSATENNLLLEYDTELKQWYPQSGSFVDFVDIGEKLYGIDSSGQVWDMDNGTTDAGTAITWYKETGAYIKQSLRYNKTLQDLYVLFDQPSGSTFSIYTSSTVDNADFVARKTFTASSNEQNVKIVIDPFIIGNSDWYRLKFYGTGPVTVHAVEQYYKLGKR